MFAVECQMYAVKFKMYAVECQCKLWIVKCMLWNLKCMLWNVKFMLWNVNCMLRNVKCMLWNVVTSCFARQTGSASVFLPVINRFVLFSDFKLHHFVHHLEKPPSCVNGTNQSIKGRKVLALPFWEAKQEVTTFSASQ